MNAQQLFHADGKPANVWWCSECRKVSGAEAVAVLCCKPKLCDTCGATVEGYWSKCPACRTAEDKRKEQARFDAAEKVTEWDGWVYVDEQGHNEGYFRDLDAYLEWFEEDSEGFPPPTYVWTCEPIAFAKTDIDHILDGISESEHAFEDFDVGHLAGIPELTVAIEAFNAANADVVSYQPNYNRALLIPAPQPITESNEA